MAQNARQQPPPEQVCASLHSGSQPRDQTPRKFVDAVKSLLPLKSAPRIIEKFLLARPQHELAPPEYIYSKADHTDEEWGWAILRSATNYAQIHSVLDALNVLRVVHEDGDDFTLVQQYPDPDPSQEPTTFKKALTASGYKSLRDTIDTLQHHSHKCAIMEYILRRSLRLGISVVAAAFDSGSNWAMQYCLDHGADVEEMRREAKRVRKAWQLDIAIKHKVERQGGHQVVHAERL
eukprot:jgi/Chrzof1/7993/UNPLg00044.t1